MLKKRKIFQKGMSFLLATALVITGITLPMSKVHADEQVTEVRVKTDAFTVEKISNKDRGQGEFDGLIEGGDIISYDRKTGEMKVLATGEVGTSYRMAINYNGDIYIGSYAGTTNNIFRIDQDENIEKVYEATSGTSMRAACEYEGNLYFGGVDSTEELTEEYENAAKLAILKMDKENPSKWDRVADFSDFDPIYAKDPAVKSQITSPIWDIVSYDGYIYATLPYSHGFIVYKGRPAVGEESQNTMYMTLSHPQSLWVLDKETGKFEKVENFSKLMEGTCNEYLWRTAEYDGELYITTMDSSVIYRYLTQYTDLGVDKENLEDKSKSIVNIAKVMKAFNLDQSEDERVQRIANIVIALAELIEKSSEKLEPEEVEKVNKEYLVLSKQLDDKAEVYLEGNEKAIPVVKAPNDSLISRENIENLVRSVVMALGEVDWQTLYMYNYIASRVNNEVQGFDMFKTADGENFTVVTKDGFGDRYNYGGRTLQPTEEGLYVGTSNPFYGAQLFKLTNIKEEPETEAF
ncbi:MAG: hypothetical protein K6G85_07040 [Eubacterium sp.]|nr:hypothetical protein [Eubacterium sp.]